jgi:hypothetical protein
VVVSHPAEPVKDAKDELIGGLFRRQHLPPAGLSEKEFGQYADNWRQRAVDPPGLRDFDWQVVAIVIDGVEVQFELATEGDYWVAIGERGGVRIEIFGDRFPFDTLDLVTIKDARPYVRGSRRMRREMARLGGSGTREGKV